MVFRVEHKVSKKCRLIDVEEADKTTGRDFDYPTSFVKAGMEGDFSYWIFGKSSPDL